MAAYEFIGFREMTGQPFRIGIVTNKAGVIGAILRINHYNFKIPLVLSLLSEDSKMVKAGLTRLQIHMIDIHDIDLFCDRCILLMKFSMNYYLNKKHINCFETNLLEYSLKVVPEILSRLCVKCSDEKFDKLVDLLIDIYKYEHKDVISDVRILTQRVIQSMPIISIKKNMDKFWNIELMPENLLLNNDFVDPFCYLYTPLYKFFKK